MHVVCTARQSASHVPLVMDLEGLAWHCTVNTKQTSPLSLEYPCWQMYKNKPSTVLPSESLPRVTDICLDSERAQGMQHFSWFMGKSVAASPHAYQYSPAASNRGVNSCSGPSMLTRSSWSKSHMRAQRATSRLRHDGQSYVYTGGKDHS